MGAGACCSLLGVVWPDQEVGLRANFQRIVSGSGTQVSKCVQASRRLSLCQGLDLRAVAEVPLYTGYQCPHLSEWLHRGPGRHCHVNSLGNAKGLIVWLSHL